MYSLYEYFSPIFYLYEIYSNNLKNNSNVVIKLLSHHHTYKLAHSSSHSTICFLLEMIRGEGGDKERRSSCLPILYVSANIGDRGTIRGRRMAEDEAKKDLSWRKVFSCWRVWRVVGYSPHFPSSLNVGERHRWHASTQLTRKDGAKNWNYSSIFPRNALITPRRFLEVSVEHRYSCNFKLFFAAEKEDDLSRVCLFIHQSWTYKR